MGELGPAETRNPLRPIQMCLKFPMRLLGKLSAVSPVVGSMLPVGGIARCPLELDIDRKKAKNNYKKQQREAARMGHMAPIGESAKRKRSRQRRDMPARVENTPDEPGAIITNRLVEDRNVPGP